jgi:two-component system, NarL family, sensor histidine kinase UhpB
MALLLWHPAQGQPTTDPAPRITITSALRTTATLEEAQFPTHRMAQSVHLPDDWWASRTKANGPVWYRMGFDAPNTLEPLLALYIPRVCSSADIYLNGMLIHSNGPMVEPVTRNCFYPQLITVSASELKREGNVLDIKLQGYALERVSLRQRSGGLSEVLVGTHAELKQLHASQHFWSVTLLWLLSIVTSVIGLIVLWFGWINQRDLKMIYLGLIILACNVLSLRILVVQWPFSNAVVEFLVCAGYSQVVLLVVQFLRNMGHSGARFVILWLYLQCALVPLSLWLIGPENLFWVSSAWHALMAIEIMGVAGACLFIRWRRRDLNHWAMYAAMIGLSFLVLIEQATLFPWMHPMRLNMAHFLIPATFAAFGLQQLQAFAKALVSVEASKLALESRVAEVSAEMQRNYTQMAQLRVEQVTEKERKRIAGDLHDDLGAKLLTIVHTSESERISTLAREALEEMRLSVKGLTGRPMRVADALADWRAETVMRLGQAGVEADWVSPTEELTQQLSARAFVQTTRILREAVSNVIKHSGASHCKIRCSLGDLDFVLIVQDNGKGIPMELDGKLDRGHGMASMKHRAKQMQGQCLVESGPGYGTVIRLTLPL